MATVSVASTELRQNISLRIRNESKTYAGIFLKPSKQNRIGTMCTQYKFQVKILEPSTDREDTVFLEYFFK